MDDHEEELQTLLKLERSHQQSPYREVFERPDPAFTAFVYSKSVAEIPQEALQETKVYSNRFALIEALPKNLSIVEIGVALGDFSEELIRKSQPKYFGAIDTFGGEVEGFGSDRSDLSTVLANTTHLEFYQQRLKTLASELSFQYEIIKGISWEVIKNLSTEIDLFYVDAGHSFEEVIQDVRACLTKISVNGFLAFNDYCWGNLFGGYLYGVIPVVNALCVSGRWKVHSFAFEKGMFCDICLRHVGT